MLNIPRYQMEEPIGSGSMGVVYHALDRLTGQKVALKLVMDTSTRKDAQPAINDAEGNALTLAKEFHTLSSIHHPYIIGMLDYGFGRNQQPYFTMEYLPTGQNLIQAAQDQPLEIPVGLLCQVLQALAYLHRRGILHRDLKPNNILVQDGRARVLDFGLSVTVDAAHGHAGTLAYMAPEILRMGRAEAVSDLYAIGVIAYQIFSGQLPFADNDITGILMPESDPTLMNMSNEPMRVYSTCYVVLQTNRDPRAAEILQTAYTQLKTYANKITDPNLRRMFLEQVAANREILALWHSQNSQKPSIMST